MAVAELWQPFLRRLRVSHNYREQLVTIDKVQRIEADDNYVKLHAAQGTFPPRMTLASLDSRLDPPSLFVCILNPMELKLTRQCACVTGGTRGIGREIVLALAAEGCRVAFCARDPAGVEELRRTLHAAGHEAVGITADVSVAGGSGDFLRSAKQQLGAVDLLVLNAGASFGAGILETDEDDWRRTFELNVFHLAESARIAAPMMAERGGGSIVIMSSISGRKPVRRRAQYAAAKAAAIQIAQSLALEFASLNIRVNAVSPGSILVPGGGWDQFGREHPAELEEFIRRELPGGRLGRPDEVANVVLFLLSQQASWINGADLPVDGGQGRPAAF